MAIWGTILLIFPILPYEIAEITFLQSCQNVTRYEKDIHSAQKLADDW
jgi:hypothetical protein